MSPTFMNRVAQFVRSPQGQRVMTEARRMSRDPRTRRQIEQVRERLAHRGRGGAA